MKKYIYILFFLLSFYCYGKELAFDIIPINLNFKGVVVKNNVTIAYADFGSILISRNNNMDWKQKKVFSGGTIVNTFINQSKIIAFNDRGEIALSNDLGENWSIIKELGDSVLSVIDYTNGFLIRMRKKLITVSNNFEKLNEIFNSSKNLSKITLYYRPTYNKSMLFINNNFVVECDSSVFIRFDMFLNPIDTLKLLKHIENVQYVSGYRMYKDADFIYLKCIFYHSNRLKAAIFRTKNFKDIEKFTDCQTYEDFYSISKGNYYSCNTFEDKKYVDTTRRSSSNSKFLFKEAVVYNDKQYIVGDRKLFEIFNFKDSSLKVVSDFSDISWIEPPEYLGGKSYLLYASQPNILYKSDDEGVTIQPTIDKMHPSFDKYFRLITVKSKYFDSKQKKLFLFGYSYFSNEGVIWSSSDSGRTFDSTHIQGFWYTLSEPFYRNTYLRKKYTQLLNGKFIIPTGATVPPSKVIHSGILVCNQNGKVENNIIDSNIIFTYVYSKNMNTYIAHACNTIDSTSIIVFTEDAGNSWHIIHKYPINLSINGIFEIVVKGKRYIVFDHVDFTKHPIMKKMTLDVVDVSSNKFSRLFEWGTNTDAGYGQYGITITSSGDEAYISFQDTLFITDNLFNKDKWKYYLLPENGRIVRPLKKIGNKFYCIYVDKNNPYGSGVHWLVPDDTISSVNNNLTINTPKDYIYIFPPYPIPATDIVKAEIYFDDFVDLNSVEIKTYNIYGQAVANKEDISLVLNNKNKARLTWYCSKYNSGIYLIQIKHGNVTKSIPIIITK